MEDADSWIRLAPLRCRHTHRDRALRVRFRLRCRFKQVQATCLWKIQARLDACCVMPWASPARVSSQTGRRSGHFSWVLAFYTSAWTTSSRHTAPAAWTWNSPYVPSVNSCHLHVRVVRRWMALDGALRWGPPSIMPYTRSCGSPVLRLSGSHQAWIIVTIFVCKGAVQGLTLRAIARQGRLRGSCGLPATECN